MMSYIVVVVVYYSSLRELVEWGSRMFVVKWQEHDVDDTFQFHRFRVGLLWNELTEAGGC